MHRRDRSIPCPHALLGGDEDHTIDAGRTVDRRFSGVLQHLDPYDVLRLEPVDTTTRLNREGRIVDDVERLAFAHQTTYDAHPKSTARCAGHGYAWKVADALHSPGWRGCFTDGRSGDTPTQSHESNAARENAGD